MSDDPFNQFHYRTTIEYDFDKLKWTYLEFGFYKRTVQAKQWINYNHSLMHDPVYPILNDRLFYYKNWMTGQYILSAFSSSWPFRVIVNPDNIDEPLSEPITANVICKSGDELLIFNQSLTFDLAYQKCQDDNLTFRE